MLPPQHPRLFMTPAAGGHVGLGNIQTGCSRLGLVIPVTSSSENHPKMMSFTQLWEIDWTLAQGLVWPGDIWWSHDVTATFWLQLHQPAHVADFISVLLVKIILNYFHFCVFQKVQSYQKRICVLSANSTLLCPCFFTRLLRVLFHFTSNAA